MYRNLYWQRWCTSILAFYRISHHIANIMQQQRLILQKLHNVSLCEGVIDVSKEGTNMFGFNLLKWIFCPLCNIFTFSACTPNIASVECFSQLVIGRVQKALKLYSDLCVTVKLKRDKSGPHQTCKLRHAFPQNLFRNEMKRCNFIYVTFFLSYFQIVYDATQMLYQTTRHILQ